MRMLCRIPRQSKSISWMKQSIAIVNPGVAQLFVENMSNMPLADLPVLKIPYVLPLFGWFL
jgi:hypothetical protein